MHFCRHTGTGILLMQKFMSVKKQAFVIRAEAVWKNEIKNQNFDGC